MTVPAWTIVLAAWLALEVVMLVALDYLHRRTGIYYLPRERPRLSRQATGTLERLVAEGGRGAIMEHSATLGWTVRPGLHHETKHVHTNARGVRGARETLPAPAPGITRVLTFGDCLTFGGGVGDDGTFQRLMEKAGTGLEVVNFGVDGYGPVQMLLRYREAMQWCRTHHVAILCMASSNVFKPLNAFRPFMAYDHGLPFGLPSAAVRSGRLEIVPNPLSSLDDYRRLLANPAAELRRVGALDHYYLTKFAWSPFDALPSVRMARVIHAELRKIGAVLRLNGTYRASSPAVLTTIRVLEGFAAEARAHDARPIIAVLPSPHDVRAFVARGTRASAPVVDALRARGLESLDLIEALGPAARESGHDRVFHGRHYSEYGNEVVARSLIEAMHAHRSAVEPVNRAGGHTPAGMQQASRDP